MRNTLLSILFTLILSQSLAMAWTVPVPVSELNTGYLQDTPFISADSKSLYFSRADGPTSSNKESIYVATREDTSGPFTWVTKILSDSYHARSPWVSADGLRMYYHNESSSWTIKVSTRASTNDPWSVGSPINEIDQIGAVLHPSLTVDEKTIFFDAIVGGNRDIWTASRTDIYSPFTGLRPLTEIMSSASDGCSSVSPDGLTIYFVSDRNANNGDSQIFKATRNSIDSLFGNLERLSAFDQPNGSMAGFPNISADGKTLYLCIGSPGRPSDIYVSYIPEPATLLLLGVGGMMIRKVKSKKVQGRKNRGGKQIAYEENYSPAKIPS
jgi:hypothetical protein